MDEADKNPQRSDCDRSVNAPRAGWATAGAWLRNTLLHFRASASPDGGGRDSELERLYDLQWQISDSARRYRDLLDAQAGLIVHRDSDGRVVFANRAYLSAFGFTESELTGRLHEPHVIETDPGSAARTVEQIETVYGPRWIVWEESTCATVSNGRGGTQRSGRDVTDERLAAEVLRQARDAALEASRVKSRFLATMSHEIRTPMNGILGMTDLLMDGPLTADQRIYTKTIAQSARALMLLIDEILDFSRIEAGKLVLAEKTFSITDTVAACIALLEPKATGKGLELSWRIDGEAPPLLCGDEARVRQILLNLVSNALKFTDAGSVGVGISATEGPGELVRVRIHVTDTGIGLNAAECVAIFAEFEQAEATVRRQDGGSGLGLAIARRIARAMKGDITAVSEPGRGSTFTAELGLERADANAAALRSALDRAELVSRPPPKPAGASGAPVRVLLAEDNPVNALLATRLLERDGCEVVRVATGDEAVAAVARWLSGQDRGYDLLLMDIYMPRLDGIEATRAIRRLLATAEQPGMTRLPIIAVTANAYAEDRRTYLAAGMDDHLAKPFDGEALKAILERWLHAKRRQSPAA